MDYSRGYMVKGPETGVPFEARLTSPGFGRGQSSVIQTFTDTLTGHKYAMAAKATNELLAGILDGRVEVSDGAFIGRFKVVKQGYRFSLMLCKEGE